MEIGTRVQLTDRTFTRSYGKYGTITGRTSWRDKDDAFKLRLDGMREDQHIVVYRIEVTPVNVEDNYEIF